MNPMKAVDKELWASSSLYTSPVRHPGMNNLSQGFSKLPVTLEIVSPADS